MRIIACIEDYDASRRFYLEAKEAEPQAPRLASANGFRRWVRAPRCRLDILRLSAGRPNDGVDGCDQTMQLETSAEGRCW